MSKMGNSHRFLQIGKFWQFILWGLLLVITPNIVFAQTEGQPPDPPVKKILDIGPNPVQVIVTTEANPPQSNRVTAENPNAMNWTKYVYQSDIDKNWEIYANINNFSGAPAVNLSNNPAADARPNLNYGATKVAFNSDRNGDTEIYMMNVDGNEVEQVTSSPGSDYAAAWSPDNRRLAFVSERDHNAEIYVIELGSRATVRLTADPAIDTFPVWSPDGNQIAWVRFTGALGTIWVMDKDGSDPHSIFSAQYLQHPSWSPDGTRIAFDADIDGDVMNEIASVNLGGADLRPLYDQGSSYEELWMGNWSADGDWIIFTDLWYWYQDGQYELDETNIIQLKISEAHADFVVSDGHSMLPDWQLMDLEQPNSSIVGLPNYSRAAGFTINWHGVDIGISGVYGYDIQTRIGPGGTWQDWLSRTQDAFGQFTGTPGDTIYFRSRAIDNAANYESWPESPSGDTVTTLFAWRLSGKAMDNRSLAIPEANITLSPDAIEAVGTDPTGQYKAHLTASADYTASISHSGYDIPDPWYQMIDADRYYGFVVPPLDDLMQNGGFETDPAILAGWETGGTLSPQVITETVHTGSLGAFIGQDCPEPCLKNPETVLDQTILYQHQPKLVIDQAGGVHTISADFHNLFYAYRSPQGTWSNPLLIGNNGDYYSAWDFDMAIDGSGNVHVIWSGEKIYYASKPATGNWSTPIELGSGTFSKIAADHLGSVFAFYQTNDGSFVYRKKVSGGNWTTPVQVGWGYGVEGALAVEPDNTVHFIWGNNNPELYHRYLSPGGALSPMRTIALSDYLHNLFAAVDPSGNLAVVWNTDENTVEYSRLIVRSSSGSWSVPENLPVSILADIAYDRAGRINILGKANGHCVYIQSRLNGGWKTPVELSTSYECLPSLSFDSNDYLHLLLPNYPYLTYQGTRLSDQAESAFLEQVINIPTETHQPTLSWLYTISSHSSRGSIFSVGITSDGNATKVFESIADADWNHAWADLSPWVGQTVTITFGLEQAANEPLAKIFLDDVTLGSWLTPVVNHADPIKVGSWNTEMITLTGENFIQTPTVQLDKTPAIAVAWLDEQHIRFQLPFGLAPGLYNIWVTNPGGQQTVLPGGLQLGYLLYAPLIMK